MRLDEALTLIRLGHINLYAYIGRTPDGEMHGHLTTCVLSTGITADHLSGIDEVIEANPTLFALIHFNEISVCSDPGIHQASYYQTGNGFTYCGDCAHVRETLRTTAIEMGYVDQYDQCIKAGKL